MIADIEWLLDQGYVIELIQLHTDDPERRFCLKLHTGLFVGSSIPEVLAQGREWAEILRTGDDHA